jgi:hemoglobin
MDTQESLYQQLGDDKIKQITARFYLEVEKTPTLRALYPEELAPAQTRLYWFLLHVFGGPSPYLEQRGHPMLRRRHFQWPIDGDMRTKWLNCMLTAIDSVPMQPETKESLLAYFVKAANHLVNR